MGTPAVVIRSTPRRDLFSLNTPPLGGKPDTRIHERTRFHISDHNQPAHLENTNQVLIIPVAEL